MEVYMSSLPDRPCLEQYRRQAKDLLRDVLASDLTAIAQIREHHPKALAKTKLRLTDAQQAIARREGFASWPKLRSEIIAREANQFFVDVEKCDVEAVQRWLATNRSLANAVTENGDTALHIAAGGNDVPLAEILIKACADPKRKFGYSAHTAMSWAITVNSFEFARELVRLGEEPDLFSAAGLGDLDRVKAFWVDGKLRSNASTTGSSRFAADGSRLPRPPETDVEVISDAFVMACRSGHLEVASWLLSKGVDLNFRGYIGGAALHWAEYSGNDDLCEMLRQAGASDELEDSSYHASPKAFGVIVPANWGLVPRLERKLDTHPDRINLRGGFGTPLNAAVYNGQLGTTQLLLSRGADQAVKNAAGLTPLELARHLGFHDIAALLEE
jgi:ankyrin repeat protein